MSFDEIKEIKDKSPIYKAFTEGYGGGAVGAVSKAGRAIGLGLAGKLSTRTGPRLGTTYGKGAGKKAGVSKPVKRRFHTPKNLIADEYLHPGWSPSVAYRGSLNAGHIKGTRSPKVYRGDAVDRTVAKMRTAANQRVKNTTVQQGPPSGVSARRQDLALKSKKTRKTSSGRIQGPKTASQQRVDDLFGVGDLPL